ncbi:FAD-binding oxidoreductase [Thermopolyspora sp. NPDC052614]|uniref:FAD-binding oxidoreductase n=1 Tax=Thermopolyspora sp. NPDC052614 TaxID=3155682 RepID=UPI0034193373
MVVADAVHALRGALDPPGVLLPPQDLSKYEISPNNMKGRAAAVIRPRTVEDVRQVLRICREHRVRLVPQGANSGLVGSGLPDPDGTQAVLSTERMRDWFDLDTGGRTLTASAGWTLDEINARLAPARLRLPIEVGSSPSVGGMVSTNTAGSNVLRHGDVRRRLLGVQAVTADDDLTVIDTLAPLRKRNEGLDVTQLFVGTEGRYGVVTAASFELAALPQAVATAWLAVPDPERLPAVLREFEHRAGEWLTSFELVSASAVRLLEANHADLLPRVPPGDGDKVLVEIGSADDSADRILQAAIETLADRGDVADAVIGPPDRLWEIRHTIPLITERMDPVTSFDISAPRSALTAMRGELTSRLARLWPEITPVELGHYGDGGLHLILPLPAAVAAAPETVAAIRRLVFDTVVHDFGGSFSAEHGIGPKNADAYARYVPAPVRHLADVLARHFDPRDILGWRTP